MGRPKNLANTLHKICPTCGTPFTCEKRTEKTYCCKKCACNSRETKQKNANGVRIAFNKKYGGHPMQVTEQTKNNFKAGMLRIHGVDHPSKMSGFYDAIKRTKYDRYGSAHYNNSEQIKKTYADRRGVGIIYNKCDRLITYPTANVIDKNKIHTFLVELLPSDVIEANDKTVLGRSELDFYIPTKKLAIEYCKLSEKCDQKYHLNKLKSCLFHGINLLHVFEDEWKSKSDIVKSIISSALGIYQFSINAYDCNIIELTHERASEFMENNHIHGRDNASVRYGLERNGEIISAMTFGKDRFSKSGAWEMYRFCDKLNHIIPESSHRLFNHFVKTHKPEKVIAYSDRRYFTHEMYYTLGFHFAAHTHISYSYVSPDFKQRFNRMMFMKHRQKKLLAAFDPSKTEWENMQAHGFDRIWDCGSLKFVWKKPIAPHPANDLHHTP